MENIKCGVVLRFCGIKMRTQKNMPAMIRAYLSAIEYGDIDSMYMLGKYYTGINDEKANYYINMAHDNNHENAIIDKINNYININTKKPQDVFNYFTSTIDDKQKANPRIANMFASFCLKHDKHDIATEYIKIAMSDNIPDSYHNMGTYYKITGNIDECIRYWHIGCDKGSVQCMYSLGHHYSNKDDKLKYFMMASLSGYSEASCEIGLINKDANYFLLAIKQNKNNCAAMFELVEYYYAKKKYADMFRYYLMIGKIADAKNNTDEVAEYYCMAQNIIGTYFLIVVEDPHAALYYLKKTLTVFNKDTVVMFNIGKCYELIGDYENMTNYYLKILQNKKCKKTSFELGMYYKKTLDFDKMVKYLVLSLYAKSGTVVDNRDTDNITNYTLGCYYRDIGDTKKMIEHYENAMRNKHDDSMFEIANYYYAKNDLKKAIPIFKKCNNQKAFLTLGKYYKNMDNKQYALEYFDKVRIKEDAVVSGPDEICEYLFSIHEYYRCIGKLTTNFKEDPYRLYMLGKCYAALGGDERVDNYLSAAIKLGSRDAMIEYAKYCKDIVDKIKYYNMANAYIELAKIYETLNVPEYVIKYYGMAIDNKYEGAHAEMALYQAKIGNSSLAIEYFNKGQNDYKTVIEYAKYSNNVSVLLDIKDSHGVDTDINVLGLLVRHYDRLYGGRDRIDILFEKLLLYAKKEHNGVCIRYINMLWQKYFERNKFSPDYFEYLNFENILFMNALKITDGVKINCLICCDDDVIRALCFCNCVDVRMCQDCIIKIGRNICPFCMTSFDYFDL